MKEILLREKGQLVAKEDCSILHLDWTTWDGGGKGEGNYPTGHNTQNLPWRTEGGVGPLFPQFFDLLILLESSFSYTVFHLSPQMMTSMDVFV